MKNLHPLSIYLFDPPCISQFPTSPAISSSPLRPSSLSSGLWHLTPHPSLSSPPCRSPYYLAWGLIPTQGCPHMGPFLSLLRLHCPSCCPALEWTPSLHFSVSGPHTWLVLTWGFAHTAWAPGWPPPPCSGPITPLWAMGTAPRLTWVSPCSVKKEKCCLLLPAVWHWRMWTR